MQPHRTRVLVVDNHPVYRDGLTEAIKRRPELQFVGAAGNAREALEEIERLSPDVALLDLMTPGGGGLELLRALARTKVPVRPLVVSASYASDLVYEALAAGAAGYLSQDATGSEISDAIAAVARGRTVLGADVQAALASEIRRRAPGGGTLLSPREREVLALTAEGLSRPTSPARCTSGRRR